MLQSRGAKDTAGQMHTRGNANTGFTKRQAWSALSHTFHLQGRIPSDIILSSERLLPPNIPQRYVFKLASPEFFLMAPDATFTYQIVYFKLRQRVVTLEPSLALGIEQQSMRENIVLPFTRHQISVHSLSAGDSTGYIQNIFPQHLPKQILIGLISSSRVTGTITENPYKFEGFHLSSMTLKHGSNIVNGETVMPEDTEGGLLRAYTTLLDGKESFFSNKEIGISLAEFDSDRRIYCFTTSPDMEVDGITQVRRSGGLSLNLVFSQPLPNAINVMILGKFDSCILIGKNNQIMKDYS